MQGSPTQAVHYFMEGAKLIAKPGLRQFILIPLLANVLIFIVLTIFLLQLFGDTYRDIVAMVPNWLVWFTWLLWPILAAVFLLIYGYSFNLITNFIAAPFFGVLAEKIEAERTGNAPPDQPWAQLIPRTIERELVKLWYFLTRGALVFLVFIALIFLPGVNILGTVLITLWGAWCMAAQYSDYPADNHQLSFKELRARLHRAPLTSYSFGGLVLAGSMIPLLNIVVTPIAVAGATLYWIDELHKPALPKT